MPLLPEWVRLVWAAVFVWVAVVHVWHAWSMSAQPRWWHTGHTLMALGMLVMYAVPHTAHPGLYRAGLAFFVLVAAAQATATVVFRLREGVLNPLWLSTMVDTLVMVYMLAFPMGGPAVVTSVLVVYLAAEVVAWVFGLWERIPTLRPVAQDPIAVPGGSGAEVLARPATRVGLLGDVDLGVRASLAVMAAGMGYMLVAMVA